MATWRVILKKTNLFAKGRISSQYGRDLKRYLARYVDEVGKAATKGGEGPRAATGGTEARWLLPEESTGVLWSGGFFGEAFSPGMTEPNKQLGWCRDFSNRWLAKLGPATRRRNDGFRFIMSLGQKAVQDLTDSGISVDQAMRSIWKQTVELYRQRHGWTGADGEIGWVGGAHHDTDNAHMHLVIFPTTKGGTPLKTNYRGVGAKKIDDLNDLIALTNISAEMFWRENLGLEYQTAEFKEKLGEDPENEPPLPEIKDFKKATVEPKGSGRGKSPDLKLGTMSREAAEDVRLALGATKPTGRRISKALRRLQSYIGVLETYGEKRSVKFWELFRLLDKNPTGAVDALEKDFPEETAAMKGLVTELATGKKWEKKLASDWRKRGAEWGRALLAAILGVPEEPKQTHQRASGLKLAAGFEKTFKTVPEDKLKGIWKMGTDLGKEAKKTRRDRMRGEAALRTLSNRTGEERPGILALLRGVVRGARRIGEILEARKGETRAVIRRSRGTYSLREIEREWTLKDGEMVPTPSKGRPWPLHLDPDLVFEELKKTETPTVERKKRKRAEIEKTLTAGKKTEDESVLERLARAIRPRRARRRTLAKDQMNGPDTPDLS